MFSNVNDHSCSVELFNYQVTGCRRVIVIGLSHFIFNYICNLHLQRRHLHLLIKIMNIICILTSCLLMMSIIEASIIPYIANWLEKSPLMDRVTSRELKRYVQHSPVILNPEFVKYFSVFCISLQWLLSLHIPQSCIDDALLTGMIYLQRFLSSQQDTSALQAARPLLLPYEEGPVSSKEMVVKYSELHRFSVLFATSMWTAIKYDTEDLEFAVCPAKICARPFGVDPEG